MLNYDLLKEKSNNRIRFNESTLQIEIDNLPIELSLISPILKNKFNINMRPALARKVTSEIAFSNSYHPIKNYLEEIQLLYSYEEVFGILDHMASRYFQVDSSESNQNLKNMILAAVNRILNPGIFIPDVWIFLVSNPNFLIIKDDLKMWLNELFLNKWLNFNTTNIALKEKLIELNKYWNHDISNKRLTRKLNQFMIQTHDEIELDLFLEKQKIPRRFIFSGIKKELKIQHLSIGINYQKIEIPNCNIDLSLIEKDKHQIWACAYYKLMEEKNYFESDFQNKKIF